MWKHILGDQVEPRPYLLSSGMKTTAKGESKIWAGETRGIKGLELETCPLVHRGCIPCVKKSEEN